VNIGHEFSTSFTKHDLSIFCANYESASILHPSMATVLGSELSILIVELGVISNKLIKILDFVVFVHI